MDKTVLGRHPLPRGAAQPTERDRPTLWRRLLARAHAESLDDDTLRDLGIARSELLSFGAEAEGRVEVTRLRIASGRAAGG